MPTRERQSRSGSPGHAVDGPTRERGGTGDVQTAHRRAIRDRSRHRSQQRLIEAVAATADVSADEVGVTTLQIGRREHMPRQDQISEARGKALDDAVFAFEEWSFGATQATLNMNPGDEDPYECHLAYTLLRKYLKPGFPLPS